MVKSHDPESKLFIVVEAEKLTVFSNVKPSLWIPRIWTYERSVIMSSTDRLLDSLTLLVKEIVRLPYVRLAMLSHPVIIKMQEKMIRRIMYLLFITTPFRFSDASYYEEQQGVKQTYGLISQAR